MTGNQTLNDTLQFRVIHAWMLQKVYPELP